MVVHVNYMGMTIDVPTRWRGVGGFPAGGSGALAVVEEQPVDGEPLVSDGSLRSDDVVPDDRNVIRRVSPVQR
jgi:hypothetical protein